MGGGLGRGSGGLLLAGVGQAGALGLQLPVGLLVAVELAALGAGVGTLVAGVGPLARVRPSATRLLQIQSTEGFQVRNKEHHQLF